MINILPRALLLTALLAPALPATAGTPSEASARQLVRLQDMEGTFQQMAPGLEAEIRRQLAQTEKLYAASRHPAAKQSLDTVNRIYRQAATAVMTSPQTAAELEALSVKAVREVYTQEEVDAMLAFYSSPAGRSVLQKTARYAEAVIPGLTDVIYRRWQEEIDRHRPLLEREQQRLRALQP